MTTSQINPNQLRPNDDENDPLIIKVGPDRRAEAIERLVAARAHDGREHARRFMAYARENHINLDHLWSRLDTAGRIEFTVLGVPSLGRTAMIFASRPETQQHVKPIGQLIRLATQQLVDVGVNLAQTLLDPGDSLEREAFHAGGFRDLALLSYLERPIRSRNLPITPPQWPAGVTVTQYDESMRDELLSVLDASYEQTLDCPGLRGCRRTEDILEGHRASGIYDPALWTILRINDQPMGTLLLNPSTDGQMIELVYLGLAQPARGRALGTQLLRHGLTLLANRPERTITLAVDEGNTPAIALYRREGFRAVMRRAALIRPLKPASSADESQHLTGFPHNA